jgi:hypothetical protein
VKAKAPSKKAQGGKLTGDPHRSVPTPFFLRIQARKNNIYRSISKDTSGTISSSSITCTA